MWKNKLEKLKEILCSLENITIALSGGVDSMTLAFVAHQVLGSNAKMLHAKSSAVPQTDTLRITDYAEKYGWDLEIVDAQEIQDENYRSNPVNRCYYCKSRLYYTLNLKNFGQVVSGTNLDDLGDYRPGLIAADEYSVRHPFVEAKISKADIRNIAKYYGLDEVADLPSSPCLASRIETGITIQPEQLDLVNRVEQKIKTIVYAENIRCRLFSQRLVVQIDESVLNNMSTEKISSLKSLVINMAEKSKLVIPVDISPYVKGSAFKRA